MTWLAVGGYGGLYKLLIHTIKYGQVPISSNLKINSYGMLLVYLPCSLAVLAMAPAVGGFVVVGQMLVEFGSCTTY